MTDRQAEREQVARKAILVINEIAESQWDQYYDQQNYEYLLGVLAAHEAKILEQQAQRIQELEAQYLELMMAVSRKFPGETCHQTALRYIRNAERDGTAYGQQAALERQKVEP